MKSPQNASPSRRLWGKRRFAGQVVNLSCKVALILGLALAIVGYFGPWVDHKTAALVLTGQDMGEFVKFLPEVRARTTLMIRELFYLPPFVAALCLILLMAHKRLAYPSLIRAVMVLTVLGLAWAMLPPVWTPQLLLTAEFRKQSVAIAFCLLLVVVHPMLRHLPPRSVAVAVMVLATLGAGPPLWQFFAVRQAVSRAYGWPVPVGWGLWATAFGFLIVIVGAVAMFLSRNRGPEHGGQEDEVKGSAR